MKRLNKSMLNGPLLPNIISYTIPIILTGILQLLFNSADMIIVGRYCGSISLAAVSATGSISALIVNLFIGLSVGAGVTVAHALGAQESDIAHRIVHTALPTAIICGIFLTFVGYFSAEFLLVMMETPDTVIALSTTYMQIYFLGITFTLVYNFCAAILRAAGDTKSPLIFLAIAGALNVLLNVIFVTIFDMNVAGVALATTISQGVSAVLVVIALMRRNDACKLDLRKIHIYKTQLLKILRIGLPAGLQSSLFAISNVVIQSSINSFGDVAMSGHAAAGNPESFVYITMNSFSQTAVNFIGQNSGARQYPRVKKILSICMACVAVSGLVLSSIFLSLGQNILKIYITDSEAAIEYGLIRMRYMLMPYFLCGMMEVSTGALRGLGESFWPMVTSVLGICGIRVVWILTLFQLPQFHSMEYLYISYTVSYIVTLAINLVVFKFVFRKHLQLAPAPDTP